MVILDTSIIIDHLRVRTKDASFFRLFFSHHPKEACAISVVTVSELYAGKSTKNNEKEKEILTTISPLIIVSYDYDVAVIAGKLMRDFSGRLAFADAAIAATAITRECPLVTLNVKDFSGIKNLTLLRV